MTSSLANLEAGGLPIHSTPPPLESGPGIFISFEGIDGAGKSSHIAQLADAFSEAGRVVCRTREPGGTPLAEHIRALLLNDDMDALTEALLVFAGRRDHLRRVIEPALARGEVVLCDRFTDASFAYQGGGRGLALEKLETLERWVQTKGFDSVDCVNGAGQGVQMTQPHCTLWFDVAPQVAAARLASARDADRFELENLAFFERVAAAYATRAAAEPERFVRIDAALSLDAVALQVRGAVMARGLLPVGR